VNSAILASTETVNNYNDRRNNMLLSFSQTLARSNGRLSGRISFQINNEKNPQPGCENTDTGTFVALVNIF
jgi:hypothetical protein